MKRLSLISWGFIAFAAVLLLRLLFLQVISHESLSEKADMQRFYSVTVEEAVRGTVFDRNSQPLTFDKESQSLLVVPVFVDDPELFSQIVGDAFSVSKEKLKNRIIGVNAQGEEIRKQPFLLKSNLDVDEIDKVNEINKNGLLVVSAQSRYFYDYPAQHLVGSLKKSNDDALWEGASGLELIYDNVLKADAATQIRFLIDEKNGLIDFGDSSVTDTKHSNAGMVKTTIDLGIQRVSESAMEGHSGAVIVMDSKNGDVLAMVSSPKYDPYFMTELKSEDVYVNKALSAYPPASLFKIFIAAVALEEGISAPESPFFCDGCYMMDNGIAVSCWDENGHGFITFEDSLAYSCNPVYIKTTLDLGAEKIENAFNLWELNCDELLGYPLDDCSTLSFSGNSNASISNIGLGESGVFLTPLTVAKMINVIASGGMLYTPRVVMDVYDEHGVLFKSIKESNQKRVLSKKNAEILASMMTKTFREGTAASLHLDSFRMAGKTGSSETGNVWIGGFFPYDDPKYTIVVLVTDGESGAIDAGPIMKKICAYLGNLP